jgi:hypothetical protein
MGQICCHETSVKDYYSTLRNIPEERRSEMQTRYPVSRQRVDGVKGDVMCVDNALPQCAVTYTLHFVRVDL